jgi:ribA/ribD-fused uncharacterized protein
MTTNALRFIGRYRFLSNFWLCEISVPFAIAHRPQRVITFPSVEHAYQALKSADPADWEFIRLQKTPGHAKRAGRSLTLRPGFEEQKLAIMQRLLHQKFSHGSSLGIQLAQIDGVIQEGNTWHDTFWGIDLMTGEGSNHLGRLLMTIRDELRRLRDLSNTFL